MKIALAGFERQAQSAIKQGEFCLCKHSWNLQWKQYIQSDYVPPWALSEKSIKYTNIPDQTDLHTGCHSNECIGGGQKWEKVG